MKIAVCLYGQPRYCELGFNYLLNFTEGFELDFYIHSWGDDDTYKLMKNLYNPICLKVDPPKTNFDHMNEYIIDQNLNSKGIISTISPLYSIYKSGKLLENYNIDYDYVILTRTDIGIPDGKLNKLSIENNCIYSSYVRGDKWIIKENNDNHIDTKFLIAQKNNILHLTKLYENLYNYNLVHKIPMCHHRLFYHHLNKLNIQFKMLYLSDKNINGGWYYIRDGNLSDS